MGQVTGSELNERIRILELQLNGDPYTWEEASRTWARAETDPRKNLFSSVGIGARGVTFLIRKKPSLTLFNAFRWRKQFCFLTSIEDADPGFQAVQAALCDPVECLQDADREIPGVHFPGILTEKYVGHQEPDLHAEVTTDQVLVTPKAVALKPGSCVTAGGLWYLVRCPHELDPFKNEYEVRRVVDT